MLIFKGGLTLFGFSSNKYFSFVILARYFNHLIAESLYGSVYFPFIVAGCSFCSILASCNIAFQTQELPIFRAGMSEQKDQNK